MVKHVTNSLTTTKKSILKVLEKCARTNFNLAWYFTTTRQKAWGRFHHNFSTNLRARPLLYIGTNLGFT
jgi:hypothetical protein